LLPLSPKLAEHCTTFFPQRRNVRLVDVAAPFGERPDAPLAVVSQANSLQPREIPADLVGDRGVRPFGMSSACRSSL
jgi:hypothetical protein